MRLPDGTHVAAVTLRSGDPDAARRFYAGLVGLAEAGGDAPPGGLALGAPGGPALVRLEPVSPGTPAPPDSTGLYHTAIRFPTRAALAAALRRVAAGGARLSGASDHGVSEALYLDDPEGNGVELYWDRPREAWPRDAGGRIEMFTAPLDLAGLAAELERGDGGPRRPGHRRRPRPPPGLRARALDGLLPRRRRLRGAGVARRHGGLRRRPAATTTTSG